jgi:hypothetical protein
MKRYLFVIVFFILMAFCCQVLAQDLTALKKRIAVINFEDRSGYGHNIGQGVADMLVTSLVESEKFIVIERAELDEINIKRTGPGTNWSCHTPIRSKGRPTIRITKNYYREYN